MKPKPLGDDERCQHGVKFGWQKRCDMCDSTETPADSGAQVQRPLSREDESKAAAQAPAIAARDETRWPASAAPMTDELVRDLAGHSPYQQADELEMFCRRMEAERAELRSALESLLYGAIESEGVMTPAGDKLIAVYAKGTLAKARAAIAKAKP